MKAFLLLTVTILLSACGNDDRKTVAAPPPVSSDPAWDKVVAVIQSDCASCHNGAVQPKLIPAAVYRASPVRAKLISGLMPPPPRVISESNKKILLDYQ